MSSVGIMQEHQIVPYYYYDETKADRNNGHGDGDENLGNDCHMMKRQWHSCTRRAKKTVTLLWNK